jgi:uncharacterized protein YegP (UPF0339 family)
MAGWFELHKSKDGQFYFVLKAGNGETILMSEMYHAVASADNGIFSVQRNSPIVERYVKKEAAGGKSYFNLIAGNYQVIGTSQMYASAAARDNGIVSVRENGTTTRIKDFTKPSAP